ETHTMKIPVPEGWDSRYGGIEADNFFCPAHARIKPFTDSQCPGCTGGWGDCPLFQAFAYKRLELTHADFEQLERGICPKRVNGTFRLTNGHIDSLDLSDTPVVESGKALAQAIREYSEEYH